MCWFSVTKTFAVRIERLSLYFLLLVKLLGPLILTDGIMDRPLKFAYIHFRSKDLEKMRSHGDFWHLLVLTGVLVIAQDEIETYTLQLSILPGTDIQIDDAEKFINESLGGVDGPFNITVDEVIVKGKWQADLSIANSFRSENGRVFLAGDAGKNLIFIRY
jgi:hypothetical protein